jgi:hypothetical protein
MASIATGLIARRKSMTFRGHVQNGVVLLDEPLTLPDGTLVEVRVASSASAPTPETPGPTANSSSLEAKLAALWADVPASEWAKLPEDLTDHLDHYIYGTAKK